MIYSSYLLGCEKWRDIYPVMCCLMMGIGDEKCVIRRFCHYVNITECIYTIPDGTGYYTPRPYGIYRLLLLGYKPAQPVTTQNKMRSNQAEDKMVQ